MANIAPLPQINQLTCASWTPQDMQLYKSLPLWFHEKDVKFRKRFGSWMKMFGKVAWDQNMGTQQQQIIQEPPPIQRQHAFGTALLDCTVPKMDITQSRERVVPMYMTRHKFRSPAFCWCPSFNMFIKGKVSKSLEFVLRDQQIWQNLFLRSALFHWSPTLMVCDGIDSTALGNGYSAGVHYTTPTGPGDEDPAVAQKSLQYLAFMSTLVGNPGNLSMRAVIRGCNILSEDLGAVPYQEGSVNNNSPLDEKFLLITSPEVYDQFADDPLYKENRPNDEDAIRHGFHGLIRDRVTCTIMSEPLRLYVDPNTGVASWPAPQVIWEDTTNPYKVGQTMPNPLYRAAQFEFSVLMGDKPGDIVDSGAPPSEFAKEGMEWNGRPYLTDQFLIECYDSLGGVSKEFNTEHEWLKVYSQVTAGFSPSNTRNAMIIMHKRKRDTSTFLW